MCGIAGIFDVREQRPIDEGLLSRMNQVQFHRGPDEGGVHVEPGLGLAHRRLSIIDLSNGRQPLFNEDHSVVVVFNGEIYNFSDLTKELIAAGHQFRTHCDTEVIVHAWEEWGEACVKRFRGMFAFAIWDRNRRTLFLARDRLGIKPLFYALLADGRLLFGSELKALLECHALPRVIDPRAVEDYFSYGYVPDPRSIFRDVHKLEPGYTLTVQAGQKELRPRQYWDVPFTYNGVQNETDAREGLIDQLREAVDMRLIADVPLGAFLSGGVDSSAIVALMAGLSEKPVSTCSISFGDPAFNEAHYAAMVAEQFGTDHQVEEVDPDDYGLIDQLAGLYDEPYADSSAMPTYRVCELARRRVTVALSGDGGDENFAGYRRYRWHMYEERLRNLMPRGLRKPLFGALGSLYPKIDWAPRIFRAKSTFQALARDAVEGYFHNFSILPDTLRQQLYTAGFRKQLDGYHGIEVFNRHLEQAPEHPLSMVQYLDMKTYLAGDILTKVDRASMAHALEVRVPILDHKFVEWVSGLPPTMKLSGGEGKYIFKRALEPHLSKEILYRRKMGFAVPLASWFRGPLRQRIRDALLGPTLADMGIFDTDFLEALLDQHQSGRRDHSAALWALLMFEAFVRNSLNHRQAPVVAAAG
ncbi:MAG: amidotransferase 1, exosortase A system-associated [Gammaproteobacteria bacterium]|jgi:asparagine synthase (glutamine-hydrolysing)|nr:amidotransferase 1, exosortase A system-associated [Gammaproteobacteria bacterium]